MNLRIPGPIPIPEEILSLMSSPMINHRGPEFAEILYRITDSLKLVFDTEHDVYVLTASGTGAMEAAVVNTLSPGDKVLNLSIGFFGDRFGDIAKMYGANVITQSSPWGSAVDIDELRKRLNKESGVKAVLVTHNETSTGVTNDLEGIAQVVKNEFGKLLLVDGVSSVGSLPVHTDRWECDAVASASQKGWMLPPGLSFLSFGPDAWQAHSKATMPRYYLDLEQYRNYYERGQPPFTPALSVIFSLDLALSKILSEGMSSVYQRHSNIAQMTRDGIKAMGLSLFPKENIASDTVTAVNIPENIDASALLKLLREEYGVVVGGGQGPVRGKILRIGHMGLTQPEDIQQCLESLSSALKRIN